MARTVRATSGADVREIETRARDANALGTLVVRHLESGAQRAFVEQRLGDRVWPRRYPSSPDPFVNKASLLDWLNDGGNILDRHFDRRPALMGSGVLAGSISGRVRGNVAEVGSAVPYAGLHQWGGTSTQPVTETAKSTIAKFIGWEKDSEGDWVPKARQGARQKENAEKYGSQLLHLLFASELATEVVQRPFLGITDEMERDIVESLETFVAEGR